jgi:hypothetical protein
MDAFGNKLLHVDKRLRLLTRPRADRMERISRQATPMSRQPLMPGRRKRRNIITSILAFRSQQVITPNLSGRTQLQSAVLKFNAILVCHLSHHALGATSLSWYSNADSLALHAGGDNGVNGLYLVCEYTPRGNVEGQYHTEVTKPGESADGQPGFGGAPAISMSWRSLLGALVAVQLLLAMAF